MIAVVLTIAVLTLAALATLAALVSALLPRTATGARHQPRDPAEADPRARLRVLPTPEP